MDAQNFTDAAAGVRTCPRQSDRAGGRPAATEVLHSLGLVRGAQQDWAGARAADREAAELLDDVDVPEAQLQHLYLSGTIRAAARRTQGRVNPPEPRPCEYANALGVDENVAELELALADLGAQQAHWQDA